MRRAFSWVVVRVAWHLTGATVVLDWDQGDFGLADKRHCCGDPVASRMALLATDWHWLPRCMQSLNAASEVCAQQQPARSLHATGSLYVNDAIAQAHARRCVSLMCMQRPCIGIACHAVQQSKQHGARCMIQHRQHFHLDDDRNNIHAATRYAQSSLQTAAYA